MNLKAFQQLSYASRLLVINQFGINVGFYMLLPFLAAYMSENLGYSAAMIGLVLGIRNLSQQGMFLIGGTAADRLGCRPMIIAGCALRVVSFGFFAIFTSLPGLVAAAVLTGLAGALFNPAVRTYLMHEGGERRADVFAVFNVFSHAGTLVGPLLGAALLNVDFRLCAVIACIAFTILTVAQVFVLPRREIEAQRESTLGSWRTVVTNVRFVAFTLACSAYFGLYNQLYLTVPLEVKRISGMNESVAAVFVVSTLIGVFAQVRITQWCRQRWTSARSIAIGLTCMGGSFIPVMLTSPFLSTRDPGELGWAGVIAVCLPMLVTTVIFTIGMAITNPFTMELLPVVGSERLAGTYYGFYYLVSSLVAAGVSWFVGALRDITDGTLFGWAPWLTLLAVGLAGGIATAILQRRGMLEPNSEDSATPATPTQEKV